MLARGLGIPEDCLCPLYQRVYEAGLQPLFRSLRRQTGVPGAGLGLTRVSSPWNSPAVRGVNVSG